MSIEKPTIFFSHSSKDRHTLLRLKNMIAEKTGNTIEIFLSSDGESIPLGKNWVYRIEEALKKTKLMFIFITTNSLQSNWIYFEAGYSYSKDIRVVPVGFLNADISLMTPPLALLQGFNIRNEDGLNNLIALVNETFSHNHKLSFTNAEYTELASNGDISIANPLGPYLPLLEGVYLEVDLSNNKIAIEKYFDKAREIFNNNSIQYREFESEIEVYGMTMLLTDRRPYAYKILFKLDPLLIDKTLSLVLKILHEVDESIILKIPIRFDFKELVSNLSHTHKLSARFFDTGIIFGEKYEYIYKNFSFSISQLVAARRPRGGATYISLTLRSNDFSLEEFRNLLEILFTKEILFVNDGEV